MKLAANFEFIGRQVWHKDMVIKTLNSLKSDA